MLTGDARLRGFGFPVVKSVLLLAVLVQPFVFREIELVLLGAGAGPVPLKQVAVVP